MVKDVTALAFVPAISSFFEHPVSRLYLPFNDLYEREAKTQHFPGHTRYLVLGVLTVDMDKHALNSACLPSTFSESYLRGAMSPIATSMLAELS